MRVIEPSYTILTDISDGNAILRDIEMAARTCYKSENRVSEGSAHRLVRRLILSGHEAMLEHGSLSVKFICDRAMSHEIVRHRLASFAQESQRYCNYSKDQFDNQITFIRPLCIPESDSDPHAGYFWRAALQSAEDNYFNLLTLGLLPQDARSVLPNATKTEIIVTANWREWRHILKLRTAPDAHPEMRRLMCPLLMELAKNIPVLFDDILGEFLRNNSKPLNEETDNGPERRGKHERGTQGSTSD